MAGDDTSPRLRDRYTCPEQMRYLAIDLGDKRTGIAVGDDETGIASPVAGLPIAPGPALVRTILRAIEEHAPDAVVLGLPLNMDGSEGPSAQSAQAFARNFARISNLPIVLVDERLSTAAVIRVLLKADTSRARRAAVVDKMAAGYILQGALDRMRHLEASQPG